MNTNFELKLASGTEEIYAYYSNDAMCLSVSCSVDGFWLLNDSVIDGIEQEEKAYSTFEELCEDFGLEASTDGWVLQATSVPLSEYLINKNETCKHNENTIDADNKSIAESSELVDGESVLEENLAMSEDIYETTQNIEVTTEDLGAGKHVSVVPPLNISDDTLKKQAEYTTTEMFKAIEKLQQYKKRRDIKSDKVETTIKSEQYTLENFKNDVQGVDADTLVELLCIKQALLLISPPGTGKTTTATALANYIQKETNSGRVKLVSINESTSYSNIIGGYQTDKNGDWVITKGSLFEMADRALADPENKYIYIMDEINRGNTEKILGEAITSISQRGKAVTTNFGMKLIIPENLWIIGTMNSTDSSITELDTALVDRFMIYRMEEIELDISKINNTANKNLISCIEKVRDTIHNINVYLKEDEFKKDDNKIGNRALYGKYTTIQGLILVVKYDIQPKVESKKVNLDEEACREINKIFENLYQYLEDAKQWEEQIK